MPSIDGGRACDLEINPAVAAVLCFLSVGNGIRKEVLKCGVCAPNLKNHKEKAAWCAGVQPVRRAGKLFESVRVYLEFLWNNGTLWLRMSDVDRIDNVYVCYCVLIWETNKEQVNKDGKHTRCGGNSRCPPGVRADGSWHGIFFAEGRSIGVTESVFPSAGVVSAFNALTHVTRSKTGGLTQAHCCTTHCTDLAPPTALAHANLLASAHHRPAG